ncbi:MAG: DNA mismatch repair protein MutS [Myxococcota bacterium]
MGDEFNGSGAPRVEYTARLDARRTSAAELGRRAARLSNLRLLVFATGVAVAWLAFGQELIDGGWLGLVIAAFAFLVIAHDRALRACGRSQRAVAFYENGLARLDGSWMGRGQGGERFRDAAHPYADDLDLFGHGSLFEFLCTARTRAGEQTLANWLRVPASIDVIRSRQEAVAELSPRIDLREDLALLGEDVAAGMHPEALREWGASASRGSLGGLRVTAAVLASLTLVALVAWGTTGIGPLPLELVLLLQFGFAAFVRTRVQRSIAAAEEPGRDLALFSEILSRLESEPFQSPHLAELQRALRVHGRSSSQCIARLRRTLELLDARRNQLFAPFGALVLFTTQLAFEIEAWRAACGPALGRWIDAVGEAEALSSFASFAFEHPEHHYPTLRVGAACFAAEGMGHPLLPGDRCVTNDVRLDGELRLLVVSGSNMSGKSTLLRSVGVNAALALTGAPVAARSLELSPMAIAASIRVLDSLLDGSSHFYAEIRRLRLIMEMCGGELPVLFLIDEILQGTNSHDRGIGAEAVVRGLVERDAVGLVTTHDLSLTGVADVLAPRSANVHFVDHLEDGAIAFDYRLRRGVVEKSNALELMRAVGLDV